MYQLQGARASQKSGKNICHMSRLKCKSTIHNSQIIDKTHVYIPRVPIRLWISPRRRAKTFGHFKRRAKLVEFGPSIQHKKHDGRFHCWPLTLHLVLTPSHLQAQHDTMRATYFPEIQMRAKFLRFFNCKEQKLWVLEYLFEPKNWGHVTPALCSYLPMNRKLWIHDWFTNQTVQFLLCVLLKDCGCWKSFCGCSSTHKEMGNHAPAGGGWGWKPETMIGFRVRILPFLWPLLIST